MKKFVLGIAVILFIVIGAGNFVGKTYAEGSVSVAGTSGKQGDTVDVGIVLNGNPGGLSTLELQVNYDSAVLECTGAQTTGLLAGGENISGARMTWIDPSASGSAANGTIGIVHFRIKDNAPIGAASVSVQIISSYKTDYSENPVSGGSGTVTVGCRNHSFGAWTVTAQPTCTAGGTQVHTCSACGYQESQATSALGHAFGGWTATVQPSCTTGGREVRKCSRCQAEEARDTAALGHAFGSPKVIKEPTETTAGLQESVCSRCGEIKQDILPRLKPETEPESSEEETEETEETDETKASETEEETKDTEGASEEEDQTSQAEEADAELSENRADAEAEDASEEAEENAEADSVSRGFFAGIGSFFGRIPEWFRKTFTDRITGHENCARIIGIQGILNLLLIAAVLVLGMLLGKRTKQLKDLRNEAVVEHIPFDGQQDETEAMEVCEISEETACLEVNEAEATADAIDEKVQALPENTESYESAVQTKPEENIGTGGRKKNRRSRTHGQQKK